MSDDFQKIRVSSLRSALQQVIHLCKFTVKTAGIYIHIMRSVYAYYILPNSSNIKLSYFTVILDFKQIKYLILSISLITQFCSVYDLIVTQCHHFIFFRWTQSAELECQKLKTLSTKSSTI